MPGADRAGVCMLCGRRGPHAQPARTGGPGKSSGRVGGHVDRQARAGNVESRASLSPTPETGIFRQSARATGGAMNERGELVAIARSLYLRGYTFGTAGNLSVRIGDSVMISPTNSSF